MRPTQQTSGTQGEGNKAARVTTKNGAVVPSEPLIDTSKLPPLESARDFVRRDIQPIKEIVSGIVTEGQGTLAAREKSGKTWICYEMAQCVASGKPFLGRPTLQGDVLYFDLENAPALRQERLLTMFPDGVSDRLFFIDPPTDGKPWVIGEGFETVLNHYLDALPNTQLVIIDVLALITSPKRRDEDELQQAYRNLTPLKRIAADRRIAIIGLKHYRKNRDTDDFLSNISGSTGWAAASDFIIGLDRKRGENEAILQTTGRTMRGLELLIEQDEQTMRWREQGDLEDALRSRRVKGFKSHEITLAVMAAVEKGGGVWSGTSDELKAFSTYDTKFPIPETQVAVTKFIKQNTDLFRECGYLVTDRNANNSKMACWIVKQIVSQ